MSQHLTIGGDTAPAGGNKDTQPIPEKQFQPWDPTKPPDFLVRWNDPSTWLSTPTGPSTTQDVTMTDTTPTRTAEQTPEDNPHDQTLSVEDASRSKSKATQLDSVTKGVEEFQMQQSQTGHSGSKG
ncbi:hypothetical protein KC331_g294 [Hortaea werneckii]|nr:hypothetical protein KC331_g294 [Hortaea werneckii]KAI7722512.1 hypothetical protein KC353_g444 [Hortaea werneckii]